MTKDKPSGAENTPDAEAIAIALKALAVADRIIRRVEIETIAKITNSTTATIAQDMLARQACDVDDVLPILQALHPDAKRRLIKTLWLVALVDNDLDQAEEKLIYQISDLIGFRRRDLIKAGQEVAKSLEPGP